MNYKQTEQFNHRKAMVLMLLANNPLDLDEMGTLVRIKQIENKLGIKKAALYRCLHSLENDGLIICTHHGYQTGINSKRWLITDKADKIILDETNINKFINMTNEYYKTLNESHSKKSMIFEDGNIGYNVQYINNNLNINKINLIIDKVNLLVIENNEYSIIKSKSRLRLDYAKSRKIKNNHDKLRENKSISLPVLHPDRQVKKITLVIKGRVNNILCSSKSGKKRDYMRSDKRLLRTDLLSNLGLSNYKEVFDIKSQIARLTYILQGGNYDDIEDFYAIDGIEREIVKKLFMYAYFDKSKELGAWHTCRWFLLKYFNNEQRNNNIKEKAKKQFSEWFDIIWDHYRKLFTPMGSEIFLWTSLWEQLIIKEARERLGAIIVNVYDGFYYNDDSIKEALNKIAAETSIEVRRLYIETKESK